MPAAEPHEADGPGRTPAWPGRRLKGAAAEVERLVPAGAGATAAGAADAFARSVGGLDVPLPADGLHERWLWLAEVAAADLSVARLLEGHVDALAILAEAGRPGSAERTHGVWASRSGGTAVRARPSGRHLVLDGVRPYCSGAHAVEVALVTVQPVGDGGDRGDVLVLVDTSAAGVTVEEGSWPAIGMAGSDSSTVRFDDVRVEEAAVIGPEGWYVDRLGFWPGSVGVAACWLGGAIGVVQPLVAAGAAGRLDPHGLAALGRAWADLEAAAAVVGAVAAEVAESPDRPTHELRLLAESARAVVERLSGTVAEVVARTLGPGPLTADRVHAQRVADLGVYVRQHHGERDLAALGSLVAERCW